MKTSFPRPVRRILTASIGTVLASLLPLGETARAVDGTWNGPASGAWLTPGNWLPITTFPGDAPNAVVPGEGLATDIALFTGANVASNVGINMNTLAGQLTLGAIDMNRTAAGNLQIGNSSTTVNGVLQLNGATINAVANTLIRVTGTLAADLTIANVNTGTTTQTMGVRLGITNGLLTVDTGRTLTISSIISQLSANSGFTKNGAGTVSLSAANTYNGTVLVTDGVLRISNATALGTGTSAITVTNSDGTAVNNNELQLTGGITVARNLILENTANANARVYLRSVSTVNANANTWSGSITFKGFSLQALSADTAPLTLSGTLINDGTTPSTQIFFRGANTGTVTAAATINLGAANLVKTDGGTWILNNTTSAISGSTTVADGTLTIGANNAISAIAPVTIGQGSGTSGTLNIANGITQTIASLTVAAGSTGTQRLMGLGSVDTGATNRTWLINDSVGIPQDLIVSAPLVGSGGITKTGAGTLAWNSSAAGPVTISAGRLEGAGTFNGGLIVNATSILSPGTDLTAGTVTTSGITFGTGATTVNLNIGSAGETVANTGGITANGTATIILTPSGSLPNSGNVNLITHNGTFVGTAGFALGALPGRVTGGLVNTGIAIALGITGNDKVIWTGAGAPGTTWDIATAQNWKLQSNSNPTGFLQGDDLIFDDGKLNTTAINLSVAANPAHADFQNTVATAYTIVGTGGMGASMILDKTGNGLVTLAPVNAALAANGSAHTYVGATNVSNGMLTLDYTGLTGTNAATSRVISPNSVVTVAAGATLKVQRNNVATVLGNNLVGAGTLLVDVNAGGTTGPQNFTLSGDNSAFTGTIKLSPTGAGAAGTMRTINAALNGPALANSIGTATLDVDAGGQLWVAAATYTNALKLTGYGFAEAAGGTVPNAALQALAGGLSTHYAGFGAARIEANTVYSGSITLEGSAKVEMSNVGAGTLSGNITNTASTDLLIFGGSSNNAISTLILTGDNSGLEKIWVNSGGSGGTAAFDILQVGNNGSTGTLGSENVILHADAARGAGVRFARTDGYTLGAGQNILPDVAAAADHTRLRLFVNTSGTGLTINNNTIDLSDGTNGGQISVGGNDNTNGVNGAIFNINGASSLVDTGNFFLGDANGFSGTVNQTDGTVNVAGNLRISHWTTNTSAYNISGGSLNFSGAAPAVTPSTAGGTEQAGGAYLGIDGTGNLTQSGTSIINTKFIVLDNRTLTASGVNMPTGIDTLTLNGGTLNLASVWGIIARNPTSTLVTLNGGTIVNTAPAGTAVVLDTPITVGATGGTLNTSANATSSLVLTSSITGAGNTITLTGAGKLTLQPNSKATLDGVSDGLGTQLISANLNSGTMPVEKIGTGTTTLAGTNNYTGATTITAGTLALTGSLGNTAVAINTGGTFAPSGNIGATGSITLNAGGTLNVGNNNGGNLATTISSGALTLGGGTVNVDFTGTAVDRVNTSVNNGLTINATTANLLLGPSGFVTGSYPAYTYIGTVQGTGATALTIGTPVGHNTAAFVDDTLGTVNLIITAAATNKWVGGAAGFPDVWNINDKPNWSAGDQKYLDGDNVLFDDSAVNFAPTLAGNVSPASVNLANSASNYTLGGAGGIAGATQLSMNGGTAATKYTLAPVNAVLAANASAHTYTGATNVNSGTLTLDYTGLTGANAATARVINNASAVTVASGATLQALRGDGIFILGNNLTGAGTVELNPHAVAGGVVAHTPILSGTNTGFTGTLRLLAPATGTWRLGTPTQANLGGASIDVQSGAQLFLGAGTYTNSLTIAGIGYADASANIGALRIDGTLYAGNIYVNGSARIGSHNSTGTISGNISGGDLAFHVSNYANNYTTILTGTNTYGTTTIGGGNTQGTVVSMRLNIGSGGTTGTLGAGNVTINGDGANGVLGFDRSNGYTLGAGQTITGGGSQITRTFIDLDTLGTGFSDNGNAITLGTAAVGGNIRVGQSRAGAIANFSGALTAQNFFAGSATPSTTNFNSGAVVSVGLLHVARTGGSGSVLNIAPGATVNVLTQFNLGEQAAGNNGTVFQSGGGVTVGQQMRIGHWPNNTSTYNLSGGTLALTANPGLATTPFSAAEQNGGIYLGIDGTGILNQSNGTVTTDWVVLDNRTNTGPGTNQPDGVDRYNLSGGTLELRGQYGIINGNATTEFSFTGGTIKNVGTAVNAGISGVGNFVIGTGGTGTPTIDTNGATNAVTVSRVFTGGGNLTKISNGTLNLNTASPAWTGNFSITGGTVATGAANGGLGSFTTAGRTISASGSSTVSLTVNNVFGSGVANPNLPSITLDASTLTSTRYNTLGAITLNGSLLTQSATDGPGVYEGYQFKGAVNVGGTALSTISTGNGRANHLDANTVFTVADATGSAATDLLVSAPLMNQSGDFGSAAGALTKSGSGTMELTAVNTYTGGTAMNGGVLSVNADAALGAAAGTVAISNGATLQASAAVTTNRTITLTTALGGKIDTNGQTVILDNGSNVSGTALEKTGAGILSISGTQSYNLTTSGGTTNIHTAIGTGSSTITANATTFVSASQNLAALTVGTGVEVTFGDSTPFAPEPAKGGGAAAAAAPEDPGFTLVTGSPVIYTGADLGAAGVIPEPGSIGLLLTGALGLLARRRRVTAAR